jgi:hypothetical protein
MGGMAEEYQDDEHAQADAQGMPLQEAPGG